LNATFLRYRILAFSANRMVWKVQHMATCERNAHEILCALQ